MSPGLDILTEKGQITREQEDQAIALYEALNPFGHTFVDTKKDRPCLVDGFLIANQTVDGVVETKCRNLSYKEFMQDFEGIWLVTWEKIEDSRRLAASLSVPLYGFLYLVKSESLLVKQLTSPTGGFLVSMTIDETETQKTVNGGKIFRNNAYINMHGATRYRYDD